MVAKKFLEDVYDISSTEDTQALYEDWAASYDEEISENGYASPERAAHALRASGADLQAPLLDIGCGTGLSGLFLKQAGFSDIDGSDFTRAMLDQAKKKSIYQNLYLANAAQPFDYIKRPYQNFTAIGMFSPGHADADVMMHIFELMPAGGYFAFSLNDHAIEDPRYLEMISERIFSQSARITWQDYGDHLPKIGLNSMIVVLEKLA